jgi:hypothetical protein
VKKVNDAKVKDQCHIENSGRLAALENTDYSFYINRT